LIPKSITNIIGEILFKSLDCQKVYFLFSNSLPLYTSGMKFYLEFCLKIKKGLFTGIVIESGFYDTQITPIFEGFPMLHCFEFCEAGGLLISKEMKKLLMEENKENSAFKRKIPDFELVENLKVIKNIIIIYFTQSFKFKFLFIPLKTQSEEYLSKEDNIQKMKKTLYDYQIETKESVKVSVFCCCCCSFILFYLDFILYKIHLWKCFIWRSRIGAKYCSKPFEMYKES